MHSKTLEELQTLTSEQRRALSRQLEADSGGSVLRLIRTSPPTRGSYLPHYLIEAGARSKRMELSGALSNPFERTKSLLTRPLQCVVRDAGASGTTRFATHVPSRAPAVAATAELVLRREGRAMRVAELHAAVCQILGRPLHPSSLRQALSSNLKSGKPRFRRVGWGVYELAARP